MKVRFSVIVAIFFGAITLFGYFLPIERVQWLQTELILAAVFLGVLAMILGAINLISVHMRRSVSGKPGFAGSMVLVFSFVLTFFLVLGFSFTPNAYGTYLYQWVVQYLMVPLEAGLSGVLAFVLLAGGARLLHRRMGWMSALFLASALMVLFALIPLPLGFGEWIPGLNDLRAAAGDAVTVIASGGGRGILLGMALGAAATGLRILLGVDRPYER